MIEPVGGEMGEVNTTINTITMDDKRANDTRNEMLKMIHLESQCILKKIISEILKAE